MGDNRIGMGISDPTTSQSAASAIARAKAGEVVIEAARDFCAGNGTISTQKFEALCKAVAALARVQEAKAEEGQER